MVRRTERMHDPSREHALTATDVDAARRRDPDAVARVYKAYATALYRFFLAGTGDRHTAEDLTGTVFAAAIEALPKFRGPAEALGGWLFRIARHDLLDYRRGQARHPTDRLDDKLQEAARHPTDRLDDKLQEAAEATGGDDPQELAITRLDGSRVFAALRHLSPDQREVLLLRMASGLSTAEVATALSKTVGAIKALQHRGLAALARHLDEGGDGTRKSARSDPYPSSGQRRLAGEETS